MCFAPSAPMPPSAWPSNVVSWEVAASCTFGRWLETLEHPQSGCWLCTGMEAIILWSFPVPCELGHWFWGPAFSHCAGSCKLCSHHSLKIPEEATMLNYTTDASAIISEVFFFFSIDFPTRGGKILILSPTTTLLWIRFFNFANCDERWHFQESDPKKIQNWHISADEFLITYPEWLWWDGPHSKVGRVFTGPQRNLVRKSS